MHDSMVSLEFQGLQYLDSKATDQALCHSLKLVILYKVIHIDAEALERNQEVLPEHHEVIDSDDIVLIELVVKIEVLKRLQFDTSLVFELLFISDDFHGNRSLCFVIKAFDSLSEATLA